MSERNCIIDGVQYEMLLLLAVTVAFCIGVFLGGIISQNPPDCSLCQCVAMLK